MHAAPATVSDAARAAAVATIQQFADAKREGDRGAMEEASQRFERVPGLRETVHEAANGKTSAEIQGARGEAIACETSAQRKDGARVSKA
jgi:hypothetical protein